MTTLRLLDDQILLRRAPATTLTAAGLHLPERDVARPLRGTVLAVGPGRAPRCGCGTVAPLLIEPGQEVLHARYAGTEVRIDNQDCLVLRESDVLGVIEEAP